MTMDAELEEEGQQRKFQKELNAGIVSLILLATLAKAKEPQYGYQIAKLLEGGNHSGSPMKQGTLYPVLRSLSAAGLLDSYVEPSVAGPPRRYYRITKAGRKALARWTDTWTKTRDFVDRIMKDSHHE